MKKIFLILLLVATKSFAGELIVISPEEFKKQNPTIERNIIVDFVLNQFNDNKRPKVSQEDLNKIWDNKEFRYAYNLGRFQIINQNLYANSHKVDDYYFPPLVKYFKQLVQKYKINDVDFIIYLRDELPNKKDSILTEDIPGFMMSKNLSSSLEQNKLLIPDAFIVEKHWELLIDKINKARNQYIWETKINKIFWRGGAHGADVKNIKYNIENYSKLPRLTLVMLSKLYPSMIDAKFSPFGEFSADESGDQLRNIIATLEREPSVRTDEVEHIKYKYLISVDGNTCAWKRVPWIMLSNSVLLKQESSNIEWFYPALKPYIHYVPIKNDLSDIFDKLNWLKQNDKEAQLISKNAHNFVLNNLLPEHIDAYMVMILNKYSETFFKDQKILVSLPDADEFFKAEPVETVPPVKKLTKWQKIKNKISSWKEKISM